MKKRRDINRSNHSVDEVVVELDEEEVSEESSSSDESEEENIALDGVFNDEDDGPNSTGTDDDVDHGPPPAKKRLKQVNKIQSRASNKNKRKKELQVEFLFCDVDTSYWDGIKTLLSCEPIYVSQSSNLATSMIENTVVGTVVTTEDQEDVFAVSSVIHYTKFDDDNWMKKFCLKSCPSLSVETAGFYIHARVINVPLKIVETLHQQLLLDIEWASKNENGEEELQTLILFSPCCNNIYKYFEDDVFESNSELVVPVDIPICKGEDKQCKMIVMTRAQYQSSIEEISKLVTE